MPSNSINQAVDMDRLKVIARPHHRRCCLSFDRVIKIKRPVHRIADIDKLS